MSHYARLDISRFWVKIMRILATGAILDSTCMKTLSCPLCIHFTNRDVQVDDFCALIDSISCLFAITERSFVSCSHCDILQGECVLRDNFRPVDDRQYLPHLLRRYSDTTRAVVSRNMTVDNQIMAPLMYPQGSIVAMT